jgi:hypothetical protein
MANPEHVAKLKEGVGPWNEWRKTIDGISSLTLHLDLSGADFSGSNLQEANLRTIDLSRAILINAKLTGADLRAANLSGADLRMASLSWAELHGTNLTDTNLRQADLSWADFTAADAIRADLTGALISASIFGNTDLTYALGLDFCKHVGPSILDHSTFVKSGQIPVAFLRGCGLPDSLIEFLTLLRDQQSQFYSCFISYSTKDQEFADRLHADLQNKGVRCWFATHDIAAGKKIHEQIDEAIRVYDRLLLILSEHSMSSEWVKTEIANARQRELNEKRQMLFPISLAPFEAVREWKAFDGDTGKDSAREIREYFIPDFSNWKDHDSYQRAFERLLRDLKSTGEASAQKA